MAFDERDPETLDTATSPSKDMNVDKVAPGDIAAKRRLEMEVLANIEEQGTVVAATEPPVDMITDVSTGTPQPIAGAEIDRSKRSKKDGANSTSQGSAASTEGTVRSQ